MDIAWTRPALTNVLEIKSYIAADSPRYGRIVAERLFAAVERLEVYPLSGRMVPELQAATVRGVGNVSTQFLLTPEPNVTYSARLVQKSPHKARHAQSPSRRPPTPRDLY